MTFSIDETDRKALGWGMGSISIAFFGKYNVFKVFTGSSEIDVLSRPDDVGILICSSRVSKAVVWKYIFMILTKPTTEMKRAQKMMKNACHTFPNKLF